MRYLKPFNESIEDEVIFKRKLTEFCQDHLAYLLDDGLKIESSYSSGLERGKIIPLFAIRLNFWEVKKSYTDIKDHLIPFLQLLEKEYDIYKLGVYQVNLEVAGYETIPADIKELVNDEIIFLNDRRNFLRDISFSVKIK
jgi:hypothetical protein